MCANVSRAAKRVKQLRSLLLMWGFQCAATQNTKHRCVLSLFLTFQLSSGEVIGSVILGLITIITAAPGYTSHNNSHYKATPVATALEKVSVSATSAGHNVWTALGLFEITCVCVCVCVCACACACLSYAFSYQFNRCISVFVYLHTTAIWLRFEHEPNISVHAYFKRRVGLSDNLLHRVVSPDMILTWLFNLIFFYLTWDYLKIEMSW